MFICCVCENIFLFKKVRKFFFFICLIIYFVLKKRLKTVVDWYSLYYSIISLTVVVQAVPFSRT